MKVILKETITNLGKAGDIVKVSDGYARNFLIPRGKAVLADEGNLKSIQEVIKKKNELKEKNEEKLRKILEKLKGVEINIKKKASNDGNLFGSVSEKDIIEELKKISIEIEKDNVIMNEHIKKTGEYSIPVRLKAGFETNIKIKITEEK